MGKPHYRLSIRQSDTVYYAIQNGQVLTRTKPYYFYTGCLTGWDKIGIIDERNLRMFGFFRNYTEDSFQFVKKAAQILRSIWFTQGRKAVPKLYVEVLNSTTQDYEFDYSADLSLSTASSTRDYLSCKVLEAGIAAYIKSREDVEYELDVSTANGAKTVQVQPLRVYGKAKWWTGWPNPGVSGTGSVTVVGTTAGYKIYCPYVDKTLSPVADTPGNEPISFPDPALNNFTSGQDFEFFNAGTGLPTNNNNFLFKASVALKNVRFSTSIGYFVQNDNGSGFAGTYAGQLLKRTSAGVITTIQSKSSSSIADGASLNGTFTFNPAVFDMAVGDTLILKFVFNTPGSSINAHKYAIQKDSPINVSFEHYTSSFNVTGLTWAKVFELLIDRITEGTATAKSDLLNIGKTYDEYYDLNPKYLLMLSGESIRGIANPKLKISLKKFLKAAFVQAGGGFGLEGTKAVLESVKYFFNADPNMMIADLGEVADLEITDATDFLFNEIHIGYPEQEYDDINGRDETNTTFRYLLPNLNDKGVYDMVSDVRADGYGIYYTWAQYNLFEKKDSRSDNDVFALQITPSMTAALYPINIVPTPYINGVLDGSRLMNPGLTPARCARRLGPFIRSWFFNQDYEYIQFQIGDRNVSLESKFAAPFVSERGNIQFNEMGTRLFMPFNLNASLDSPTNYNKLWQAKRNGWFKFSFMGVEFKGFPVRSASREAIAKLQDWKILAFPTSTPASWVR